LARATVPPLAPPSKRWRVRATYSLSINWPSKIQSYLQLRDQPDVHGYANGSEIRNLMCRNFDFRAKLCGRVAGGHPKGFAVLRWSILALRPPIELTPWIGEGAKTY
jgi:hypothetical protein